MVRRELIGKNGENVKELEQRTDVIKICTMEHLKAINQRRAQQNMQPSFHEEEPSEDPNMMKLVIIVPKEMVPFAKMLIKSQVTSIQERQKFIDRQREANMEMNDGQQQYDNGGYNQGYDQQYDDGQHWDQYGSQQQMTNNYGNGNGQRNGNQRSPRRQRRQQQQQQQTERSAKSTEEFNYLNNGGGRRRDRQQQMPQNNDPHYPGLGAKGKGVYVNDGTNGGGDAKDVSHDEDAQQQEKSWVDMQENEDEEEEQHYEQPQRDVRKVNQQQQQKNNNKQQKAQIWKVKSTNEESNEVEVNE